MVPELVTRGVNMKLVKNLLVVIAATTVMGSAQAQSIFDLSTLTPTVKVASDTIWSLSPSFADTVYFTLDANNHLVTGTMDSTNISNLKLELFHSGSTLSFYTGTGLNLYSDPGQGNYYALISGNLISPQANGTFTGSVAAVPEPAEGMLLLCGVVVARFMARRKIGMVAG
jgi:hypothetical protein